MAKKSQTVTPASPTDAVSSSAQSVATSASNAAAQQADLVRRLLSAYMTNTPSFLKLIDAYLLCVMLTGIIQFVYVILAGTYPYNSFLAGFGASVGSFVLAGTFD